MQKRHITWHAGLAALVLTGLLTDIAGAEVSSKESVRRVESDVQAPVRQGSESPVYPEDARKERIQGTVVVLSVIDREGAVDSVEVVDERSAEREDLRQAALEAVQGWTFEPATLDGEPVAVYYSFTINFRLSKDGKP